MSDQHTPAIVPPGDAPLPWSQSEVKSWHIHDADGKRVAVLDNDRFAAYAVAAANALPGLVEFVACYADNSECECYATGPAQCFHCGARAALAALPGEVRGS